MRFTKQWDTTDTALTKNTYFFWDTIPVEGIHLMIMLIPRDNFDLHEMIATVLKIEISKIEESNFNYLT